MNKDLSFECSYFELESKCSPPIQIWHWGVHKTYLPTGNYSCRTFKHNFQEEEKTGENKGRICSHKTLLTQLYAWKHSEKYGHIFN